MRLQQPWEPSSGVLWDLCFMEERLLSSVCRASTGPFLRPGLTPLGNAANPSRPASALSGPGVCRSQQGQSSSNPPAPSSTASCLCSLLSLRHCAGPSHSLERQTESRLGMAPGFPFSKDLDTIVLEPPFPGGGTSLTISSGPLGEGAPGVMA